MVLDPSGNFFGEDFAARRRHFSDRGELDGDDGKLANGQ